MESENVLLRARLTELLNEGIPPELAADVKRRMAAGLPRKEAIEAAKAQAADHAA